MGWKSITTLLLAGLAAAPLAAQSRGGETSDSVPAEYRPPPGMCRIWIANVPPGRQPAPTDCATAVRNRPSNGRVLFGDDYVKRAAADTGARQRQDRLRIPGEPRYQRETGKDERDERLERGLTADERKRGGRPGTPEKRKKPTR